MGELKTTNTSLEDEKYMRLALELAEKGAGWTNPNPMVGAVIVKNHKIIGRGYHEKYGELHAERNALVNCHEAPEGAVMYVSLEPCCHYGKTPPCTEAIIESKIARVVIGTGDPNTMVAGKGIEMLKNAGIQVTTGVLEEECRELNHIFFHYMQGKIPFVAMKYAMTADGKIAAYTGKSKWITGEAAREHVHGLRQRYMGIMIGIGTLIADDPLLTCRLPIAKNPIRIICDTNLRIPENSRIVATAAEIKTYIATAARDEKKIKRLMEKGCKIIEVPKFGEHIDLTKLMELLGSEGIDSILLEGGGRLNFEALQGGIVDHVYAYIAPKLLGGAEALTPIEGGGMDSPDRAYPLKMQKIEMLGEDVLIEYKVDKPNTGG